MQPVHFQPGLGKDLRKSADGVAVVTIALEGGIRQYQGAEAGGVKSGNGYCENVVHWKPQSLG